MRLRGREFVWGRRTYLMGVVNVTPDSFSDGGEAYSPDAALEKALSLVEAGADILDIGGESSRPFSEPVDTEEELRRVIPAIRMIRRSCNCPVSIDTTKARVARAAIDEGADLVNDISAMRFDPGMAPVIAGSGVPVVLMHMKGSPRDMQRDPWYEDVIKEIKGFLAERISFAQEAGIARDRIVVDPGIGFGKRLEDNLSLIRRLRCFTDLGCPILVGPSRKAFLGSITGIKEPKHRDVATLGAVAVCVANGADIIRVHDVNMTRQVTAVVDAICRQHNIP